MKKKEQPEVNKKTVKQEYVAKTIAQLQQQPSTQLQQQTNTFLQKNLDYNAANSVLAMDVNAAKPVIAAPLQQLPVSQQPVIDLAVSAEKPILLDQPIPTLVTDKGSSAHPQPVQNVVAAIIVKDKRDTSFSLPLHNVVDEIAHGDLRSSSPIIQQIPNLETVVITDGEEEVVETQFDIVVDDSKFDKAVQEELKVVNKLWADIKEGEQQEPFTQYVSKHRMKLIKKMARSAGQPYNTRSTGVAPHLSS
ncbi:hypothetical protein P8452_35888 [Trifolium repens]|nr:hypothetical protein P8452_35888 [Trifolium repens]